MKKKLLAVMTLVLSLVMLASAVTVALSAAKARPSSGISGGNGQTTPSTSNLSAMEDFILGDPASSFDFSQTISTSETHNLDITEGNGFYTFTATGQDPYTYLNKGSFKAGKYVAVTYRSQNAANCTLQFYIGSSGGGPSNDSTMLKQSITADGEWHMIVFDTSSISPELYDSSQATYFRLDPLEGNLQAGYAIDIKSIDFYADGDFDYEGYAAYMEAQEAARHDVAWDDPTFVEQATIAEDTYAGSLTYTPSEDGSLMTISYIVNGETVSHTVPNKNNYLFGGYVGTDDLGRELYTADDKINSTEKPTVGVYGENDTRYVGLFYFLWIGEHGDSGVYDLQKILDNNPPEVYQDAASGVYGPVWSHHWFAEPLYGYYYSKDTWVMRKHAELLCNANIDFLYLDVTNGMDYTSNAMNLMAILHDLNTQGFDAPQVVFYTNSSSSSVINTLYNNIYKPGLYEDTWFRLDGKPVIVGTEDNNSAYGRQSNGKFSSAIKNFFTIKEAQWPNEPAKDNAWPWMDWNWPQRVFANSEGKRSAISVSIAQHQGTVAFSTSAFYGDSAEFSGERINRGRSFNARASHATSLINYRKAWIADPTLTNQGLNFQAQWDIAHNASEKSGLEFVLVTGWNEWVAQRIPGATNPDKDNSYVYFVDTASMEYSRDAEMMRGGYFDNYYMQLIQNIERLKGDAPVVVQDSRKPINVTGSFDQWDDIPVTYYDVEGDIEDRNCLGFGQTPYTNTTGRNDILTSKITADTKNIYFYAQTKYDVTMFDTESTWMQLFIDMDDSAKTGWYGYDYIINYQAKDQFTTTVAKYVGTDGEYAFEIVGEVSYRAKDNEIMIAVPQDLLGVNGKYLELNFQFKWADSDTKITTMEQFYTDGDVAPLGRLNYVFQNYIPGKSSIEYPDISGGESESESITETQTETESTVETEDTTESSTETEKSGGCGSLIATGSVTVLASALAAAWVLRKKED